MQILIKSFLLLFILIFCTYISECKKAKDMPVIVIDPSGHLDKFHGIGKPFASILEGEEGDEEAGAEDGSNDLPSTTPNSTALMSCTDTNSTDCCYKFTWPGLVRDFQKYVTNSSCARFRKENAAGPEMACFDPIVFTNGSNRPDIVHLMEHCHTYGCAQLVHCIKAAGETCIKYSYYNSDGEVLNETRFCGRVTDEDASDQVFNGCFRQNIIGRPLIREVCTCDGSYACNLANYKVKSSISNLMGFALLIFLITGYLGNINNL